MTNWLKKRLPPAKSRAPMWVELTESVQEFWDDNYEPLIDSVERARSVFTADAEDVEIRLAERGIKFEVALPFTHGSKAVSYAMRSYELHRKDDEAILTGILGRDFPGIAVRWMPLQAPKAEPYGSRFLTELDLPWFDYGQSELWLTSRGKVLSDINTVLAMGFTRAEVKAAIERKISQLKPAHIVFDGVYFIAYFTLVVEPCELSQCAFSYSTTTLPIIPFPSSYFDETRLDDYRLDMLPFHSSYGGISTATIVLDGLAGGVWRLDLGWIINGVQRSVPGIEGDSISALSYLGADSSSFGTATIPPIISDSTSKHVQIFDPMKVDILPIYQFDLLAADDYQLDRNTFSGVCCSYSLSSVPVKFDNKWRLDLGWMIDGVFRQVSGVEGDAFNAIASLGKSSSYTSEIQIGEVATQYISRFIPKHAEYPAMEVKVFRSWYFDDTPADATRLDSDTVSARAFSVSRASAAIAFPDRPWRLDMGMEIDGYFRAVAGNEDDLAPIFSSLGCDGSSTLFFSVGSTAAKLEVIKWPLVYESAFGDVQPKPDSQKTTSVFDSFVDVASSMSPRFIYMDEIPADFIPLDMSF